MVKPSLNNQIQFIAILANSIAGNGKSITLVKWLEIELNKKEIPFILYNIHWPTNFLLIIILIVKSL